MDFNRSKYPTFTRIFDCAVITEISFNILINVQFFHLCSCIFLSRLVHLFLLLILVFTNYKLNYFLVRQGSLHDKPFLQVGRDPLFRLDHLVLPKIAIKKFLKSVTDLQKRISFLLGYMNVQIKLTRQSKCQPTAEPSTETGIN